MRALAKLGRLKLRDAVLLIFAGLVVVVLVSLGNWQMDRLAWKTALIDAVEARAFGDPVAPRDEEDPRTQTYLRVIVTGEFRLDLAQKVKAVTGLGPGHWLMVPLSTETGFIWINLGFVPSGSGPEDWWLAEGPQTVTGLLRETEPEGTFLESNDPAAARWVTRDIAALSQAARLERVAPYFIDATHAGPPEAWPRGGLTKLVFTNPHLSYALTWYAMAGLLTVGVIYALFFAKAGRGDRAV